MNYTEETMVKSRCKFYACQTYNSNRGKLEKSYHNFYNKVGKDYADTFSYVGYIQTVFQGFLGVRVIRTEYLDSILELGLNSSINDKFKNYHSIFNYILKEDTNPADRFNSELIYALRDSDRDGKPVKI